MVYLQSQHIYYNTVFKISVIKKYWARFSKFYIYMQNICAAITMRSTVIAILFIKIPKMIPHQNFLFGRIIVSPTWTFFWEDYCIPTPNFLDWRIIPSPINPFLMNDNCIPHQTVWMGELCYPSPKLNRIKLIAKITHTEHIRVSHDTVPVIAEVAQSVFTNQVPKISLI